ncbi:type II toxin-antitoxin system RelE/ParE family toxin [Niastella sp. MAH-29]|uniref:Type II toxin-antitoxin system RelE/ParE family toxin n=1 Tax=Niastella soli TaxID=2821487 RepID=A0ABS3YZY2_9BACT|nr:type II toxin-antitoxin system RelE/ParE family toxin [Niastella soli]
MMYLISELETAGKFLSGHPLHYTSINDRFRRLRINRFPYLVVYESEEDVIKINAVRRISRKPKY